jgi:cysteine desulfurase / selenocysteine lyase
MTTAGSATPPVNPAPAASAPDLERLRGDFPILRRSIHGHRLVYLDSAATSQKPEAVLAAIDRYYRQHNANVHRGLHTLSSESTDLYEDARRTLARFVGAADEHEIVFTRGTTESINLVACAWGFPLGPSDAVVVTEMEHHSNIVPWQLMQARTGVQVRYLPLAEDGTLDLDTLDRVIDKDVKLLAFVHVSNALGTVNPVETLVAAARSVGAKVLLDGAQSVPHRPVDVQALGVDFLAWSGHKMLGPTGIGCLWARREILEEMMPYQGGGEMIATVRLSGSTWAEVPAKFEAGTPPIAPAIGLAEAARYLTTVGMASVQAHTQDLVDYALARLDGVPGLHVYGPRHGRSGSVAFTLEGIHPHDLSSILDSRGIAIRAGHHCTMPVHERLGLPATARASFYLYNTREDVDALIAGLEYARTLFGL